MAIRVAGVKRGRAARATSWKLPSPILVGRASCPPMRGSAYLKAGQLLERGDSRFRGNDSGGGGRDSAAFVLV